MSHFRPWDLLHSLVVVRYKGGSSDPNPNIISDSTKKQWEVQAKQWNDFVDKYEPRIDYAQGILTKDTTNDIRGAVRSALFDKYDVNKAFAQPQVNENTILKNTGELGYNLAKSDIGATQQAKDQNVSNLTSALNTLQGSSTSTVQGLNTLSSQAIQSQLSGLKTSYDTEAAIAKTRGSAIGSGVIGGIGAGMQLSNNSSNTGA